MKLIRLGLILCSIAFGLGSCASFMDVQMPEIERISNVRTGELREGRLAISFTTEIRNPDKLKFRIRRVQLDVMLNGNKVGEIRSNRVIRIRNLLQAQVEWTLMADLKALIKPGMLLNLALSGRPQLGVEGHVRVSKFIFRKTIPVKLNTPISLPKF